jgi:Kef-type K+ transport system membrane component KefB
MLFLAYGAEFVLIGVLLGPYALNLLSADIIDQLEPLINIALGWIGLMFGLQFRLKDLKLLPPSNYIIAGTESLATFVLVFAAMMATMSTTLECALILASIAIVSSPAVVAAVVKQSNAHGRASRLMRYVAGMDNAFGIVAFGLAYPFFHLTAQTGQFIIPGWSWLLLSVGVGLLLGMLFHFFTAPRASSNENLMIAVGMVVLSSGIAGYLHLSALFINLIVGVVLCNYSERQDRFYRLLIGAEKPLYGILLIMAGALWRASWLMLIMAAVFMVSRFLAKTAGSWALLNRYRNVISHPWWFGSALIAQGGIALAITLDYRFLAPGEASNLLVSIILTSLAINAFICPFSIKRILRLEGETT